MTSTPVFFPNLGYLTSKVPDEIREELWSEIEDIRDGRVNAAPANHKLVGYLQQEYYLTRSKEKLSPFLFEQFNAYDAAFNYTESVRVLTRPAPYVLGDLWVNFQYKNEYNPVHDHSGIISFVIWVKIPYDIEEERAVFPKMPPEVNNAASFNFVYTNSLGQILTQNLLLSKDDEWTMAMFPAGMKHNVHPFYTSDEPRISVSGNILLHNG